MSRSNVISKLRTERAGQNDLLRAGDPEPVEVCHPKSVSPILLLCEHAGQAVPQVLDGLGLTDGAINQHIGWDIGAESLARAIEPRLSLGPRSLACCEKEDPRTQLL